MLSMYVQSSEKTNVKSEFLLTFVCTIIVRAVDASSVLNSNFIFLAIKEKAES